MARGSVYKRSGGWAYRVDAGQDPGTGRRNQMSKQGFRTKREAELAMSEAMQSIATNSVVSKSSMRLGEYLDGWLPGQASRVRETTLRSYDIAVQRIKGRIGFVPLQSLTALQVERFYTDLLADGGKTSQGLAAKTVRNTHVVLRKALSDAERLGLVARNVASTAQAPTARRPEFTTWSSDELREFFASARDDRLFAAFVLLATTGMRRGEALGLRWPDVDFDAAQLAVVQTLTTVGTDVVITQPKTQRSRRTVYLDEHTIKVLQDHRQRQRADKQSAGDSWDGLNDLVFRTEIGHWIHPDRFSRDFARLASASGLPPIRLHDLRHTHATLALKAGVHPKVVSERLGHATVGITLDLYSHVTPGIARDAAEAVAAKIFR
jgi:integrase